MAYVFPNPSPGALVIIPALNFTSGLAAFVAAGFWFAAGRTPPPAPVLTADADRGWGQDYWDALSTSARMNRTAARFAGAAALLQAAVGVLTAVGVR